MKKTAPRPPPRKNGAVSAWARRLTKARGKVWLLEAHAQCIAMADESRRCQSMVAADRLLGRAQKLQAELAAVEAAEAEGGAASEEEFLAWLDRELPTLPVAYLERAVAEYLRRHPGVRLVGTDA